MFHTNCLKYFLLAIIIIIYIGLSNSAGDELTELYTNPESK